MPLADELLLQAMLGAVHDPDPDRAFRFHPPALCFAAGLPRLGRAPSGGTNRRPRWAAGRPDVLAALGRLIPARRPADAPCCVPACC